LFYHLFAAEGRRTNDDAWKEDVRAAYRELVHPAFDVPQEVQDLANTLRMWSGQIDLTPLPAYSIVIRFSFRLYRPYLSKDDTALYILDNPVRKEKVFGVPMVAPTQWKGALRTAMTYQLADWWLGLDDRARVQRAKYRQFVTWRTSLLNLFGNEKGGLVDDQKLDAYLDQVGGQRAARLYRRYLRLSVTPTGLRAGRLRFFPTFFTRIGLEVINPHERPTRAGTLPIYIESVPRKTSGVLTLLYVPFDCIGADEAETRRQVAADLEKLGKGLQEMLTVYGFGAKTSSGFGVAEDRLVEPGRLVLKAGGLPPEEPREPKPARPERRKKLRRYWKAKNQLKDEFLTPEGEFVSEEQYKAHVESLGQEYTRPNRQLYRKARKWWEREGKALAEQRAEEPEPEPEMAEPEWAERTFTSLGEMVEKMESLAEALLAEEE
jgi:CRISPR-associated protein Cmr2